MADFANLESTVSAALSAATPDVSAPAPAPAVDPTPSLAPQDVTPAPEPEAPAEEAEFEFPEEASPAPEPAAEPEASDDPEAQASGITKLTDADGKPLSWAKLREALFTDPRGHKLYNGFKLARELEKPIDQGGIGGVPSVESVREMHQVSQAAHLMAHKFHFGDPTYAGNFIKQWFAPGPEGHSAGAQLAAQSFLPTLQQMAQDQKQPEAYRAHAARMYVQAALPPVKSYLDEVYSKAFATPELDRRIELLNAARIMEEDIYGKMRDLPPGIDTAEFSQGQAKSADPRAADLDAQVRYINDFKTNQQKQAEDQFRQGFNGQVNDGLMADVTAALKPLADALPARVFAASQASFIKDVRDRVNANPAQLRNFTIARDQASRSRSPQDVKAAADAWRSVARPIIKQLRAEYLKDALPQIKAASDARHTTLGEASQKTGTSSVAQPVAKNLAGTAAVRGSNESHDEYLNRVTRALVGAAS